MSAAPLTVAAVRAAVDDGRPARWWGALQDVLDMAAEWEAQAAGDAAAAADPACPPASRAMLEASAFERRARVAEVLGAVSVGLS